MVKDLAADCQVVKCAQVHMHKDHRMDGLLFESDTSWYERQQSTWFFRFRPVMVRPYL